MVTFRCLLALLSKGLSSSADLFLPFPIQLAAPAEATSRGKKHREKQVDGEEEENWWLLQLKRSL